MRGAFQPWRGWIGQGGSCTAMPWLLVIRSNAQTTNNLHPAIVRAGRSTVLLDGSGNNSISGNGKWN